VNRHSVSHEGERMSPNGAESLQFTGQQQLIYTALGQKSQELAALYESALRIYRDNGNPARLVLAAHSIREMMGELPKIVDLPVLTELGRLGDQVNALEPLWHGAAKSRCHENGAWAGEIDGPLLKLLEGVRRLFEWRKETHPKRRDITAKLFRQSDPFGLSLPRSLERERVDTWLELHSYFVRVAHRSSTTDQEFTANMGSLEQILLDTLYRQPSVDLSAIDSILEEEEPDA
jgi:hypothetical protein